MDMLRIISLALLCGFVVAVPILEQSDAGATSFSITKFHIDVARLMDLAATTMKKMETAALEFQEATVTLNEPTTTITAEELDTLKGNFIRLFSEVKRVVDELSATASELNSKLYQDYKQKIEGFDADLAEMPEKLMAVAKRATSEIENAITAIQNASTRDELRNATKEHQLNNINLLSAQSDEPKPTLLRSVRTILESVRLVAHPFVYMGLLGEHYLDYMISLVQD